MQLSLLLDELREIAKKCDGAITRNFYRANTQYKEADWQEHFGTFKAFVAAAGLQYSEELTEQHEMSDSTWTIQIPRSRICTLEALIEACEIDLSTWKVKSFIANKWESNSNEKGIEPLFQIKATLERKQEVIDARKEIEELKNLYKKTAPQPKIKYTKNAETGNLLEINIPDIHFGKLAWGVETGHENYDSKIAEVMSWTALVTLVSRVKEHKFDKVLFVVGNDILNSDDIEGRTTKGTNVTTDGRYHRTFKIARSWLIKAVELLRQLAPVEVMVVPGNHDQLSAWHLGDSLECYFHKYDDVRIHNNPTPRKYVQFGKVMLMFTHGDKGKRSDYPLLMATEQPVMFGATKFREVHTGHLHMTKLEEQHGVRVRILPALCPPDDWHSENGYVGNIRAAEAYVWNKEEGLIGMAFYNDQTEKD